MRDDAERQRRSRDRLRGYRVERCPKCSRGKRYLVEIDDRGNEGFAQCADCGFSPQLLSMGFENPYGSLISQRRRKGLGY